MPHIRYPKFPIMKVEILKATLVLPATPPFTEPHALPLSHLDTDPNLDTTFRYVRAYADTPVRPDLGDPFDVIAASLSAALVHYHPLAATLRRRDHYTYLLCTLGQGVPLVRAAASCTLQSVQYLEDAEPDFVNRLVPEPDSAEVLINPCMLQVTVFECGGFSLGAAIHHSICDGLGATRFFNLMAEIARGSSRVIGEFVWDREVLLGPRNPPRVEGPVSECLNADPDFVPYSEDVGRVMSRFFNVRDECLNWFKAMLLEKSGSNFTTFEALGAFIWKAKVEVSNIPPNDEVKFAYSVNIRKLINPPLPPSYWGNGCVPIYVKLKANDLINQSLWKTASLIKKSKSNATDEYVRSFIDLQELHRPVSAGKHVSGFTDWRHLGHSTVDFGWGGPATVFPLSQKILGSVEPCFFLPSSMGTNNNVEKKSDGFKVLVNLRESAMEAFAKEMDKFNTKNICF